ncbi:hypothetical protein WOC76_04435 [Methylocystis sp. IM3]|jgi:hypothetical protein
MSWQSTATLIALAPLAPLWAAFTIAETRRAVAAVRKGGRNGR